MPRNLEHPGITAVIRDGVNSCEEPVCPICCKCGAETFFLHDGDIVGCDLCTKTVNYWELSNG